ncbi:CBL-interacting serine/threonine-protein kinase 7-like [Camellia sinensis]|uniref:CBL-interacting serine/threonine-protein kinase 7-like n=1 Tax=Camellia sinensis TaxID=4442 RepID=UPI001035EEAC|nr:CBL-interacting serine/threonine-protein kinase 7-like [Camellia sinensis]
MVCSAANSDQILTRISEFGLSALPENQLHREMLQTACGTPAYTSPEVFRRRGYDGAKADAWSCGVILFLFVTGNLPFDDSNLAAMYQKIRRREFKFPTPLILYFILFYPIPPHYFLFHPHIIIIFNPQLQEPAV